MLPPLRRYKLFTVVAVLLTVSILYLRRFDAGQPFSHNLTGSNAHLHSRPSEDGSRDTTTPEFASSGLDAGYHGDSGRLPDVVLPGDFVTGLDRASKQPSKGSAPLPPLPETIPKYSPGKLKNDKLAQIGIEDVAEVSRPRYTPIHWKKTKEHFPVPSDQLIHLPSGSPRRLPVIQSRTFETQKYTAQDNKLAKIRNVFSKHWKGYETFAWEHDELRPVTGSFADPFAGWRATLVDSLDTLWIMGLKSKFEEAVTATGKIDFTTTSRQTLPLFEVVIRYLGGLISAYDVSGAEYKILLEKAEELAEVLFGAFDTPNRMPMTHFTWTPIAAEVPRKAPTSVVLAEIGSLSLEFTRLAQITGKQKYYDAVARITNELDSMQDNTTLPGLWPVMIDSSGGCVFDPPRTKSLPKKSFVTTEDDRFGSRLLHPGLDPELNDGLADDSTKTHHPLAGHSKEHFLETPSSIQEAYHPFKTPANKPINGCVTDGLKGAMGMNGDRFTLGGMADSVYEYLPKEYLLLGGLEEQYRRMHDFSTKTWKEYLLIRAMIKEEERKIIFAGDFTSSGFQNETTGRTIGSFRPVTGHLDCFLGAYVGLGAKAFDIDEDMELAKQLTDGCIWAYEQTATGIMPENFEPVVCKYLDTPCPWNETQWWDAVDPYAKTKVAQNIKMKEEKAKLPLPDSDIISGKSRPIAYEKTGESEKRSRDDLRERSTATGSADKMNPLADLGPLGLASRASKEEEARKPVKARDSVFTFVTDNMPTRTTSKAIDFNTPTTIAEMVELDLYVNPVPPGMAKVASREYILRPEAIESVFYMWRMTGDNYWREKGWAMFESIERATSTKYGNSAIADVLTEGTPVLQDSAESFWTAETLKYFYLLFADVNLVSLDDYVLNTEAHPFRRPK